MDPILPFDLQRMFLGEEPPLYLLEIITRVFFIYGFSVLALRYMGKRGRRQMTPFEYMVIIALGSATGDSMFYPEVPILYAWLVIIAVVVMDNVVAHWQVRYKSLHTFMEDTPQIVIRDGRILEEALLKERIRLEELFSQLRENEVRDVGEIRCAFLEPSGNLGIIRYDEKDRRRVRSTLPEGPC